MNSLKTSAAAAALGLSLALVSGLPAQETPRQQPTTQPDSGMAPARNQDRSQSASRLIGQDVKNPSGDGLGQVKDLVIDARAGKIVYALVSSGGLLGVGERIRAVPFAAFQGAPRVERDLVLAIDRAQWNDLPAVREAEIDALLTEARGRPLFERFGLDWKEEMKRHYDTARAAADSGGSGPSRLMRASHLTGQPVTNAGQKVGTIEDLIVDLESRRAAVLLDPDDDYTGTSQKFIVSFDQLSQSLDDRKKLTTPLTRAEFGRANPAQEDWWMIAGGYPYIWAAYGTMAGPGATVPASASSSVIRERAGSLDARDASGRPTLTAVRGALRNDADLANASREVSIEQENETLVLNGTVDSRETKERIGRQVERYAEGWKVDNRLEVRSAVE